ncbi:MAG: RNA methyltransferase [Burkholderiales bacterium]|nr:RNA methyltransferase [Burkholderiales bacterium]
MTGGAALARVRVVLVGTSHPGNIGAAARALKTMGLARLALVNPRRFPDPEADARASGAADLLASATVHASLADALAGTRLAIAFTARPRDLALPMLDAAQAGELAAADAAHGEVALVFGNETYGLANDEIALCQRYARIDADPGYASLNLAAAVQVAAHEVRKAALRPVPRDYAPPDAASHEDVEILLARLERALVAKGHLDPADPKRLTERLRTLFHRARLSRTEVDLLHGVIGALEK